MDIHSLSADVRGFLRSGINITNVSHCVKELVYNSLDAKSTAVAVRINLQNCRVQVVDNGKGISRFDMAFLGVRYTTSKCQTLQHLKNRTKYYGFRGESLASIASVSQRVTVTSKQIDTDCTYVKVIENKQSSEVAEVKDRAEHGTTVTVENFLFNMPVRRGCIRPEQDVDDVKKSLELLVVIHPGVSFTLRNDASLKIVLKVNKSPSVLESFVNLHPDVDLEYLSSCEISKSNVTICGLVYKKSHVNKHLQLIFVNKRPVTSTRIYKQIKTLYKQARKTIAEFLQSKDYPVYVLNIDCPYSEVDLAYSSSKTSVEFKDWDLIDRCIDKLFCKQWGVSAKPRVCEQKKARSVTTNTGISISNIMDVVKSKPLKRKSEDVFEQNENAPRKQRAAKKRFLLTDNVASRRNEKQAETGEHQRSQEVGSSNMNMRIFSCNNQVENLDEIFSTPRNDGRDLEDQTQGKDLIMNLFLKSTAVYTNGNEHGNNERCDVNSSDSAVCVERTEQNILTTKQDHNTTMTYSVKVTTEKTVKRNRCADFPGALSTITFNNISKKKRAELLNKVCYVKKQDRDNDLTSNKCVQTSFLGDFFAPAKEVASKFVQTDSVNVEREEQHPASDIDAFHYYLSQDDEWDKNFQQPHEYQTSNTSKYFFKETPNNESSNFNKAIRKSKTQGDQCFISVAPDEIKFPLQSRKARECTKKKLARHANCSFFNHPDCKTENVFSEPFSGFAHNFTEQEAFGPCINDSMFSLKLSQEKKFSLKKPNHSLKKPFSKRTSEVLPEKLFLDNEFLTRRNNSWDNVAAAAPVNFCENKNDSETPNCEQSFQDLFRSKKPGLLGGSINFAEENSLEEKKGQDKTNSAEQQTKNEIIVTSTPELHKSLRNNSGCATKKSLKSTSTEPLLFSISEGDKRDLLKNDIDMEEEFNKLNHQVTQDSNSVHTNNFNTVDYLDGWIKQNNIFGPSIYYNKSTGMAVKEQDNFFTFKERLELLPKGCSPIMSAFSKVDKILSPNSKEYLEKTILKSFQEELQTVKWHNYCDRSDWASFLDELYKQKARKFEGNDIKIPIVSAKHHLKSTFSKDVLSNVQLLGQVDKKFIAMVDAERGQLFLCDQHAVHERIRVEMLVKEYREDEQNQRVARYKSSKCSQKILITLSDFDVELIKINKNAFDCVGLHFNVIGNTIEITKLPDCFLNKAKRTVIVLHKMVYAKLRKILQHASAAKKLLECLAKTLLAEVVEMLKSTKGCLATTPTIIVDVINNEACRGAIKFGDYLTRDAMKHYLGALNRCNLPFQCAHGRPTLTSILCLQQQVTAQKTLKPNLKILFRPS